MAEEIQCDKGLGQVANKGEGHAQRVDFSSMDICRYETSLLSMIIMGPDLQSFGGPIE